MLCLSTRKPEEEVPPWYMSAHCRRIRLVFNMLTCLAADANTPQRVLSAFKQRGEERLLRVVKVLESESMEPVLVIPSSMGLLDSGYIRWANAIPGHGLLYSLQAGHSGQSFISDSHVVVASSTWRHLCGRWYCFSYWFYAVCSAPYSSPCLFGFGDHLSLARVSSLCVLFPPTLLHWRCRSSPAPSVFLEVATHFMGNYGFQTLVEATLMIRQALELAAVQGQQVGEGWFRCNISLMGAMSEPWAGTR